MTAPPSGSAAVRTHLVDALQAELVGPFDGDPSSGEVLSRPPSRFYLTGVLAPSGDRDSGNPDDDEEMGAGSDSDDEEQSEPTAEPKVRKLLPASIGLSVLPMRGMLEMSLFVLDTETRAKMRSMLEAQHVAAAGYEGAAGGESTGSKRAKKNGIEGPRATWNFERRRRCSDWVRRSF